MDMIWLAAVLAAAAVTAWLAVLVREHGPGRLAWRFLSGHSLDGGYRTNATWLHPATNVLHPSGRAVRWHHWPRLWRAAVRTGALAALIAARAWPPAGWLMAAAAVLGAGVAAWRKLRGRRGRRTWLQPLHLAAHDLAGWPKGLAARKWITVELDGRAVTAAVLRLPPGWPSEGTGKARLVAIAGAKLGIEAPEATWRNAGPAPQVTLRQSAPPPPRVTLAQVMPAIDKGRPDELVWGIGKQGALITTSLSGDSPHVGLSMGSGAGKSVTARALLAQMLYRGAVGLVLDYKMISHQWAQGLPNVVIARRPAEIHDALLWLAGEVERRNEVALAGADLDGNVHSVVGPRLIVLCEELNATVARLRAYWRQVRDREDPARSPALEALDAASFMGRQVLVNIIYIGQRLSVKASGGDGDARENIGVLAFGRYSASNWKMLAGDHPMPPKSLTPGRIQVVTDTVRETQAVFAAAAAARHLATAGQVTPLPAGMPGAVTVTARPRLHGVPDVPVVTETPPAGMSLREAVEHGVVPLTLAALRQRRQRDKEGFPGHIGYRGTEQLFDPVQLAQYGNQEERRQLWPTSPSSS